MPESARSIKPNHEISDEDLDFFIQIAKKDAERVKLMREAYLRGETAQVLELVRQLCDIPEDQKQIQ
jgi:hypothetical protein